MLTAAPLTLNEPALTVLLTPMVPAPELAVKVTVAPLMVPAPEMSRLTPLLRVKAPVEETVPSFCTDPAVRAIDPLEPVPNIFTPEYKAMLLPENSTDLALSVSPEAVF